VRLMPFAGLALISLGMVTLFLDLEYKLHVLRFYFALQPASPMSWGAWILMVVYPFGLLQGLLLLSPRDRAALAGLRMIPGGLMRSVFRFCDRRRRLVLWASIVAGVSLGTYTGLLLGTLGARPLWNTTILGPLFLISGLSTGAAFMMLFRPDGFVHDSLSRLDIGLIITELVFIGLFLMTLATGSRVMQSAAHDLLGGRWTAIFWTLVVFLGLLVPLALEVIERRRHVRPVLITSVLILLGGLSLRWILLIAGQATAFAALH
jgi:protein NrfD